MVEPIGFEPIHQWNRVTAGFDSPTSTGLQNTLSWMDGIQPHYACYVFESV